MYNVIRYTRANNDCPFDDYLATLTRSGAKKDIAKILAAVDQLKHRGAQALARETVLAEKMNDVWQLRPVPHRIFFFFDPGRQRYVLLQGYRKKSQKTPPSEIERAERLMVEYYRRDH
jgi:phage-related protein